MSGEENHNVVPEDLSNYKVVRTGNLVVNKMKAWQGSLGVAPVDGIVSPAYFVFEFRVGNAKYGHAMLRSRTYVDFFARVSDGVRIGQWDLSLDGMRRVPVLVPPLDEQSAIVRFLDHADRRIRRYIRAKQKLIRLLEEQKQAIIHRAVTRGLDPNARLKPSGVEWLGEVPEHWGIVRSKRLFIPRQELARPGDVQLSATQAFGVIPQDEYERRVSRRIVKIFRHLEKRRHVDLDDFVISMRSFQGGLERAWASGCIRSSYIVLRPSERVNIDFFAFLFKSAGYVGALQATANFIRDGQDLNFENFCAVDLPRPPIDEQGQIAQAISRAIQGTLRLLESTRKEIDLVLEYRTRLIADVVTGKLDVREAAAGLADEVEEELVGGGEVEEAAEEVGDEYSAEGEELLAVAEEAEG